MKDGKGVLRMRLFISIELPEKILSELTALQERLAGQMKHGRLTARHNLHLTIRFLGEVSPGQVFEICQALRKAARSLFPFSLELDSAGGFGDGHPYRVIWAGIADEQRHLARLYSEVSRALAGVGISEETRDYHPHITLGRDVTFLKNEVFERNSVVLAKSKFEVNRFYLMESRAEKRRRIYRSLETFSLVH